MKVRKDTIKLTAADRKVLIEEKLGYLVVLFVFNIFVVLILLIFAWDYIFNGTALDRIVIGSVASFPTAIGLIYVFIKWLDLLAGRKEIIRGIIQKKYDRHHTGEGGGVSSTFHYFTLDKDYQVGGKYYQVFQVGDSVILHRTVRSKEVFKVEVGD